MLTELKHRGAMLPVMQVAVMAHDAGKLAVVEVRGEIDLYSCNDLYNAFMQGFQTTSQRLLIDLGEVAYLDSSGVGVLIRLLQQARHNQIQVAFCGLQEMPRKVLHMSHILPLMVVYENRKIAMAAITERSSC